MKTLHWIFLLGLTAPVAPTHAAITITVTQGEEANLAALYDSSDLIQGLIPVVLPGDLGWHPANADPADQLPAFTDGIGLRATGLSGLLADFPGPGNPTKRIDYTLAAPADIFEIRVFTGNNGRDGRVFHAYTVQFSSDAGQAFTAPVYVQSHPSGTINNSIFNQWRVVLSQLQDTEGFLASRVTQIRFDFYAADNSQGQTRDPFDGFNPFSGIDDGYNVPISSPLVWEIDVLGQYSPPRLVARRETNDLIVSWVAVATGAVVQTASSIDSTNWQNLDPQPAIVNTGNTNTVTLPVGPGNRFFRVRY